MIRYLSLFLFFLTTSSLCANEIAITFDDAPRPNTPLLSGEERTEKLIENLKKSNVPDAMFFVTTNNITQQSKDRLNAYTNAGFHLANHSHSHLSANKTALKTYTADITLAQSELTNFDNLLPFYRYPFLHEGKNKVTRDAIRQHLSKNGYQNGYVTVDNFDWYMDSLLQQAVATNKQVDYEALKNAYVSTLWDSITFYDNIAKKSLGRSPKHVLLLHENDIAALFIGDLVKHIRAKGWTIISPQEAYLDPIAKNIPDTLYNGQGRVAAIAHSQGWDEKLLRDQGSSEKFIEELFKKNNVFK